MSKYLLCLLLLFGLNNCRVNRKKDIQILHENPQVVKSGNFTINELAKYKDTSLVLFEDTLNSHLPYNFFHGEFSDLDTIRGGIQATSCYFTTDHLEWYLNNIQFHRSLSLLANNYYTPISFSDCTFLGNVTIYNDTMKYNVTFNGCHVNKSLEFHYDSLSNHLSEEDLDSIEQPDYGNDIMFRPVLSENYFGNGSPTQGTVFLNNLKFDRNTVLAGCLDLSYCQFLNSANLIFNQTYLPDTLILFNTFFSSEVDLLKTFPNLNNHSCQINLVNTNIDKIKIQYANFHLFFPANMLESSLYKEKISKTYLLLLDNFKKNNFLDSHEKLDIEYREWQSKENRWLKVSYWWWRFGYEKWRVLVKTLIFLFGFSILNYLIYPELLKTYYIRKLDITKMEKPASKIQMIGRKYMISLFYTGLIFFKLGFDFNKINFNRWGYVLLILFQYSIGLLCTGFLLNWILSK